MAGYRRNLSHTTPLRDLPKQVRVTRPHHPLEGKVLEVFGQLRYRGKPHFILVLPDGSRSYFPVAWTEVLAAPPPSQSSCSTVACASDLLRLRERIDCLLCRINAGPITDNNLPTQESQHATAAATGALECRTPSHSTHLSTAHASAAKQSGQSPGPAHSQAGSKCHPQPTALNATQKP